MSTMGFCSDLISNWVASDPDDDKVIECAVEAQADYIVTGNMRHFPERVRGVVTPGPRAFLDVLSRSA